VKTVTRRHGAKLYEMACCVAYDVVS